MRFVSSDGNRCTVELPKRELIIAVRALSELANGISPPEWEFPTIVGASRSEVRQLLIELHQLLVGKPRARRDDSNE